MHEKTNREGGKKKSREGWLNIILSNSDPILAVYRTEGNIPVLKDEEVILVKIPRYEIPLYGKFNYPRINLLLHGINYHFIRASLLKGSYEDQLNDKGLPRTKLSESDFYELKRIINEKLAKIDKNFKEKNLEGITNA